MTRLIVDPNVLYKDLSGYTDSNTCRVRILGQVMEYRDEASELIISRIPNLAEGEKDDSEQFTQVGLNVFNILSELDSEVTYRGSLVDAVGYWNGKDVNVIECQIVNGQSVIPDESVEVLKEMGNLKSLAG